MNYQQHPLSAAFPVMNAWTTPWCWMARAVVFFDDLYRMWHVSPFE